MLLLSVIVSLGWAAAAPFSSGFSMVCQDGECPGTVAAFISRSQNRETSLNILCSSTLIAGNRVITNLHCVREDQRSAGADCSETSEIIFPKTKEFRAESFACKNIVTLNTSDWAVIEFEGQSARPVATLARARMELSEKITAYPIFYNDFFPIGELHAVTCSTAELGYMDHNTFHPESRSFFATECSEAIRVGNSGTSFYNQSGEFVGLLNSASHHAYVSDAEVQAHGSTSIRGLKSSCIEYNQTVDPMCGWAGVDGFQSLAIDYSTLISFAKKATSFGKPSSAWMKWQAVGNELNLEYFAALYPFTTLAASEKFLKQHHRADVMDDMRSRAARILQWQPVCVQSSESKVLGTMPYQILNYHDNSIYPDENGGFFLSVLEDLQLNVFVEKVDLSMEAVYDSAKAHYTVHYKKTIDPYALSESEQTLLNLCIRDGHAKIKECKTQSCKVPLKELMAAPQECERVFKKRSNSHYLQPFSFALPRCT